MSPALLARVLRAAADEADRIEAERRAERRDWTDQTTSPLGRRRHVAAVKRLVAAGDVGAAIVGRRHLLSSEALAAVMTAQSNKPKAEPSNGADRMRLLLGGVR